MAIGQLGSEGHSPSPNLAYIQKLFAPQAPRSVSGPSGPQVTAPGDPNATAMRYDSQAQYPAAAAQKNLLETQARAERTGELLDSLGIERPESLAEIQDKGFQDNKPSTFERILGLLDGPRQAINLGIQDIVGGEAEPGKRNPTAWDYLDALTGGMKDKEQFQAETGLRPESGSHSLALLGWEEIDNVDGLQPDRLLRGIADFAFQVVTDPLSYITFGASGIGRRALGEAGTAIVKSQADEAVKVWLKGGRATSEFGRRFAKRADEIAATLTLDVPPGIPGHIDLKPLLRGKVQAHIEREMANEVVGPLIGRKFGELSDDVLELLPAFARGGTRFSVPFLGVKSLKRGAQIPGTRGLGRKVLGDPIRDAVKAVRAHSPAFEDLAKVVENIAVRGDADKAFLRSIARGGKNDLQAYHWLLVRDAIANRSGRQSLAIAASRLNDIRHTLYKAGEQAGMDKSAMDQFLVHFRGDYGGDALDELLGVYAGKNPELVGLVQEFSRTQTKMIDDYFQTMIDLDPKFDVQMLREHYLPLVTGGDGRKVVQALSDIGAAVPANSFNVNAPEENFGAFILANLLESFGFGGQIEGSLGSTARMMDRGLGNTVVTFTDGDPLIFVDREVIMRVKDRRALDLQNTVNSAVNARAPLSPAQMNDIIEPHVLKLAEEHGIKLGPNGGRLFEEDPFQLTVDYMRQMDNAVVQRRIIQTMEESGMVIDRATQVNSQEALIRISQGLQKDKKFAAKAAAKRMNVYVEQDQLFDDARAVSAARLDSATGSYPTISADTLQTSPVSRQQYVVDAVERSIAESPTARAVVVKNRNDGVYHYAGSTSTEADEFSSILFRDEGWVGPASIMPEDADIPPTFLHLQSEIREGNAMSIEIYDSLDPDRGREMWVHYHEGVKPMDADELNDLRAMAGANNVQLMHVNPQLNRTLEGKLPDSPTKIFAIIKDPEKGFDEATKAFQSTFDRLSGMRTDFVELAIAEPSAIARASKNSVSNQHAQDLFEGYKRALGAEEAHNAMRAAFNLPPLDPDDFTDLANQAVLLSKGAREVDISTETLSRYLVDRGTFGQQFDMVIYDATNARFVPLVKADGKNMMRNALKELGVKPEQYADNVMNDSGRFWQLAMNENGDINVIRPNKAVDGRIDSQQYAVKDAWNEAQVSTFIRMHGGNDATRYVEDIVERTVDGDFVLKRSPTTKALRKTYSAEDANKLGDSELFEIYSSYVRGLQTNDLDELAYFSEKYGDELIENLTGMNSNVMRFEEANRQFRTNLEKMGGWSRQMIGEGLDAGDVVFPETFKAVGDVEFEKMLKDQKKLAKELGFIDPDLFEIKPGEYSAVSIREGFVNPHRFAIGGAALSGKQVQRDLALWFEQLTQNMQAIYTPMGIAQLKATTNSVVNWWKGMATITRPSFHVRNLIGGVWNNQIIGVGASDYLKVRNGAIGIRKVLRHGGTLDQALEKIPDIGTRKMFRAAWESGVLDVSFSRSEFRGITAADRTIAGKVVGAVNPFDKDFGLLRGGAIVMESVEDFLRLSAFSAWFDPSDVTTAKVAKEMALAVHFDYTNLTEMETMVKKFVPFFVWARRNIPLQAQQMLERPGLMNRYSHMMQALDDTFPKTDEEQFPGSRYDTAYAAGTDLVFNQGTPFWARAIVDPDLPIRDLLELDPLHPSQIAEHMAGLLGPHITLPFDLMDQQDWGDVNAPAGLSHVARSLAAFGLFDERVTPQGDVKIPYWARTLYNTAFPWARETVETVLPPTDPRQAQAAGQLPESEGGQFGSNLINRFGLTAAKGFGVKTVTPANTRQRTYEANIEIDNILDNLQIGGQIQPTAKEAEDIKRYSMFSSGR